MPDEQTITHPQAGTTGALDTLPTEKVDPDLPSIPGYQVLGELGRGGMGVVYLARQLGLERHVALKMIRTGELATVQERDRFLAEAAAIARLQHPGIVQVHEIGTFDGRPFFALEYVEGGNLASRLTGEPLPPRQAAELVEQLARAMQHAHERGVIHRDLKPANVLLASGGREPPVPSTEGSRPPLAQPKIADFGIARLTDTDSGVTATGAILGTPAYASPEQAAGLAREAAEPADIHALGVILYELLTGRPPFRGATALQTLEMVRTREPVAPRSLQPGVPRDLETICLKCLHKTPARRYSSAGGLADDLARFLAGEPIRARPVGSLERIVKWARRRPATAALIGVILLALLGGAVGVWMYQHDLNDALEQVRASASEAREGRETAKQEAEHAQKQERLAREQLDNARRSLYTLQLTQATLLGPRDPVEALALLDDNNACRPELRDFTWGLQHRLARRELRRLSVHGDGDRVVGLVFTPDGRSFVTAGQKSPVQLWDLDGEKPRATFDGLHGHVLSLALSPAGSTLAAGCDDGRVVLWDMATRKQRRTIRVGDNGLVQHLAFSPDNQSLVASGAGMATRRWSVTSGADLGMLMPDRGSPYSVAWSSRGSPVAVGRCFPRDLALISLPDERHTDIARLERRIAALAFSPDGSLFACLEQGNSIGEPAKVRLWETESGKPALVLESSTGGGDTIAFSPDGNLLAFPRTINAVGLVDVPRRQARMLLAGHPSPVSVLAFHPAKPMLAAGCENGQIVFWDVRPELTPAPVVIPDRRATALAFSPDGHELALGISDTRAGRMFMSQVTRMTWPGGRQETTPPAGGTPFHARYSPDGKVLAVTYGPTLTRHFDRAGKELAELKAGGRRIAFHPEGRLLACATGGPQLRLCDTTTGESQVLLQRPEGFLWMGVAFSSDGRTLYAAGGQRQGKGEWIACDLASREVIRKVEGHERFVMHMDLSQDGTLATADSVGMVKTWDTRDGSLRAAVQAHTQEVTALAFDPKGKTLVTGGRDGRVRLWDPKHGQARASLSVQARQITALAFHPDGKTLLAATWDGAIYEWNAD